MKTRLAMILGLLCAGAWAGPEADVERRLEEIRAHLEQLRAEAMELHAQKRFEESRRLAAKFCEVAEGAARNELLPLADRLLQADRHDLAVRVRDEAHRILTQAREVHLHVQESDRRQGSDAQGVLEGLEQGVRALEALGKKDEAERLRRIAMEVAQKHRAREPEGKERDAAMHRIEVMQVAAHAFRETEKRDAVELMERAIHALKMRVEGRDDPEARQIREKAPPVAQQAELLMHAAKIWDKFGHETKAKLCMELGRELQASAKKEKREPEPAMHRIEKLEARVERMEGMLEEIRELLRRREGGR